VGARRCKQRATTLKWNSNGGTDFDSTRGNNVLAQEDANGNNGFGMGLTLPNHCLTLFLIIRLTSIKNLLLSVNRNFAYHQSFLLE
jgi:hypothetical protein